MTLATLCLGIVFGVAVCILMALFVYAPPAPDWMDDD